MSTLISTSRFRAVSITTVLALVASVVVAGPARATEDPEEAATTAIVQGLRTWAGAMGGLALLPETATPLPMTDVAVRDALELDRVLRRDLEDALLGQEQTLDTLAGLIESAPTFEDVSVERLSLGQVAVAFDVAVERTVPLPISYDDQGLRVRGGGATGGLAASLGLHVEFLYDPSIVVPQLRFVQTTQPTITMTAATAAGGGEVALAPAVDGFVDVALDGSYAVDWSATLLMRDPNGRDQLAEEDLEYTAPADLFDMSVAPAADAVAITLGITSDLVDGSGPHGTVSLEPAGPGQVFGDITVTRSDDLALLTSATPGSGLGAFSESVGALLGAQSAYDVPLPMLDASLTDVYAPGTVLFEVLQDMARATFSCGATDTNPPVGRPAPGADWYCQGAVEGSATGVTWSVSDGTVVSSSDASAGQEPTANARIAGAGGLPRLTVSYVDGDGVRRTARSLVESAHHLSDILAGVGFSGHLAFDAAGGVLTFDLAQALAGAELSVTPGGAGVLGPVIGLRGLRPAGASTPPVTLTTGARRLTGGFGLALDAEDGRRAFLQAPGGRLLTIDQLGADLPAGQELRLDGRIGFLGVDVAVERLRLSTLADGPAVTVDLPVSARAFGDGTPVPDVVLASEVVADPSLLDDGTVEEGSAGIVAPPEATIALDAEAAMTVSAAPLPGGAPLFPAAAPAGVTVVWDDLVPNRLPRAETTPAYETLRMLDLRPTVAGAADAAVSGDDTTVILRDAVADFVRDFGPAGTTIRRPLANLDDNATCAAFTVVDPTTLACDAPLVGEGTPAFDEGDVYLVDGDPTALRSGIFDGLLTQASLLQQASEDGTFPLLDLTPARLAPEQQRLLTLLGEEADGGTSSDSLQELVAWLRGQGVTTAADIRVDTDRLELRLVASSDEQVSAPLLVRQGGTTFTTSLAGDERRDATVATSSVTTLGLGVDLAADPDQSDLRVLAGTGTRSTAADDADSAADLVAIRAQLGGTDVSTGPGAGDVVVGFDVAVVTEVGATWSMAEMASRLTSTRTGTANDCTGDDPDTLAGDVCARIVLVDTGGTTPIEVLRFAAPADQRGPGAGSPSLEDLALARPLELRYGADALPFLADALEAGFDGDRAGVRAVLIGDALDAGVDIAGIVRRFTASLRSQLRTATTAGTLEDFETRLRATVSAAAAAHPDVEVASLGVRFDCTTPTAPSAACSLPGDVRDVAFDIVLVSAEGTDHEVRFGTGIPSLPLWSDRLIPTRVDQWSVPITFGIDKVAGPYLAVDDSVLASVSGSADLPTPGPDGCHDLVQPDIRPGARDASRCLDAVIGVFPATLTDWTAKDGGSDLTFTTSVAPVAGPGRHDLGALFSEGLATSSSMTGAGQIAVQFETWGRDAGLYDVGGTLEIDWTDGAFGDVNYANLFLDKGTFDGMLKPLFDETDQWLGPIRPILDVLRRPLPVVSDLSRATGGPTVSLLTLLFALGTASAARKSYKSRNSTEGAKLGKEKGLLAGIALIEMVGQFSDFVADVTDAAPAGTELLSLGTGDTYDPTAPLISLGSFELSQDQLLRLPLSCKEKLRDGQGSKKCNGARKSQLRQQEAGKPKPEGANRARGMSSRHKASVGLSVPAISFPVLDDASQTYEMLLGEADGVLYRADFGYITMLLEYQAAFGPFFVGGIPTEVVVGGSIKVRGRFSFGFDLLAVRQAADRVASSGDADRLLSELRSLDSDSVARAGFFFDDLDGSGADIPEIQIVTTIYAGVRVSVSIFKVGLDGGVELTIDLDANDPDGDGRIRVAEFAAAGGRTECAFNTSGRLSFFLAAVLEVDLGFLGSKTYRYRFLESPPISLFKTYCAPVRPVLGVVRDQDGDGDDDLVLTIGSGTGGGGGLGTDRAAYLAVSSETYVVRHLGTDGDGTRLSVEAFNLEQRFTIAPGGEVFADAGVGDDTIRLEPGERLTQGPDGTRQLELIPFTVPSRLSGGPGRDTIAGGDATDLIDAGPDADEVATYGGDDQVTGGTGPDRIDLGPGDDIGSGGDAADLLVGGAGVDRMFGDGGDDRLDGGTGFDPQSLFPTADVATIEALLDGGDLLAGGPGSDTLDGSFGSDVLIGGDPTAADRARGTRPITIAVDAMDGRLIRTLSVRRWDIVPPTSAEQVAACTSGDPTSGGASASDVDVVSGGPDRDYLFGGDGHDRIEGGGGPDVLCGRNGDDLIIGDGGARDPGADLIRGGVGRDRLFGDGGDDVIHGDANADLIRGGEGADTIHGGPDADLLLGGPGGDTILGEGTTETVPDWLVTPDVVSSGDDRVIECATTTLLVTGRFDVDDDLTTTGDAGDDGFIEGFRVRDGRLLDVGDQSGGTRYLTGQVGSLAVAHGEVDLDGDGFRTLQGDTLLVELARMESTSADGDCILAGDGDDTVDGGLGGDHVEGGAGRDVVDGGEGADFLRGGDGADTLRGGRDDDFLVGDAAGDRLEGNEGADRLRGGAGDDILIGGSSTVAPDGADALFGGRGDDILAGDNAAIGPWASGPAAGEPWARILLLGAAPSGVESIDDDVPVGAGDELFGGFGRDVVFGQLGDDDVRGGPDDDHVEGGPGNDEVRGDAGDDVVVGGSSTNDGLIDRDRDGTGMPDGADHVRGGEGHDVVVGDHLLLADVDVTASSGKASADVQVSLAGGLSDTPAPRPTDVVLPNDQVEGGDGDDLVVGDGLWILRPQVTSGTASPPAWLGARSEATRVTVRHGDDRLDGGAGRDVVQADHGVVLGDLGASWERLAMPIVEQAVGLLAIDHTGVGATGTGRRAAVPVVDHVPGRDHALGGDGDDVLMGDHGFALGTVHRDASGKAPYAGRGGIVPAGPPSGWDPLYAAPSGRSKTVGADTLNGERDDDVLFGQYGDDELGRSHGKDRRLPEAYGASWFLDAPHPVLERVVAR